MTDQLKRELAEARQFNQTLVDANEEYIERAEKAKESCRELEADARRYRWLNSQDHFMIYIAHSFANKDIKGEKSYRLKCGEVLDSWIDARIAAAIESEKGDSHE